MIWRLGSRPSLGGGIFTGGAFIGSPVGPMGYSSGGTYSGDAFTGHPPGPIWRFGGDPDALILWIICLYSSCDAFAAGVDGNLGLSENSSDPGVGRLGLGGISLLSPRLISTRADLHGVVDGDASLASIPDDEPGGSATAAVAAAAFPLGVC